MDLSIIWNVGSEVIPGLSRPNKYALFFIGGIILGYYIVKRIYKKEKVDVKEIDNLLMWVIVSTIVGARLGHVFFYDWDYYKDHLGEIIAVWKGGLASHGAAIGIILGVVLFRYFSSKRPVFWTLDRAVVAIAIAACFIRVGNLMNSEIKGKPGDGAMSMVFVKNYEKSLELDEFFGEDYTVSYEKTGKDSLYNGIKYPEIKIDVKLNSPNNDAVTRFFIAKHPGNFLYYGTNKETREYYSQIEVFTSSTSMMPDNAESYIHEDGFTIHMYMIPRIPTQIIEAVGYLLIFLILFTLYWKTNVSRISGFLFGAFLIGVFGFRVFVEYLKEGQAERDAETILNTGQMLSIPFVLVGLYFVLRRIKEVKKGYPEEIE